MRSNWMYKTVSKPVTFFGAPKSVIYLAILVAPATSALMGSMFYMLLIVFLFWAVGVIFGKHDPEFFDLFLVKIWKLKPTKNAMGDSNNTVRYEP